MVYLWKTDYVPLYGTISLRLGVTQMGIICQQSSNKDLKKVIIVTCNKNNAHTEPPLKALDILETQNTEFKSHLNLTAAICTVLYG